MIQAIWNFLKSYRTILLSVLATAGTLWVTSTYVFQVGKYFQRADASHLLAQTNEQNIRATNEALQKIVETERLRLEQARIREEEQRKTKEAIAALCRSGDLKNKEKCAEVGVTVP